LTVFKEKFNENSGFLGRLEKEINPLLISSEANLCEEESLKALAHVLQKIVDEKLTIPKVTRKITYTEFVMDLDKQSEMIIFQSNLTTFKLSVVF